LRISQLFLIPFENISITKPRRYHLKEVNQLPLLSWEVLGHHLLSGTPFHVQDGDILLFKDITEPEKNFIRRIKRKRRNSN